MSKNILLGLSLVLQSAIAFSDVDKERLQKLIELPRVHFSFGFNFTPDQGIVFGKERVPAEIEELRRAMKGNASDADRYKRLGELYRTANDHSKSQEAFARATELYGKLLKAKRNDGPLLVGFGQSLEGSVRRKEAEAVLRKAIRIEPGNWQGWVALGRFLQAEAMMRLIASRQGNVDPFEYLSSNKPNSQQITQAEKLFKESNECLNRAVIAAPQNAAPYRERAVVAWFSRAIIRATSGERLNPMDFLFSAEVRSDWRQAARLTESYSDTISVAVLVEVMAFLSRSAPPDFEPGKICVVGLLANDSKDFVLQAMERLARLAESKERGVAADAHRTLGILSFFVAGDPSKAESHLRRAIALDPSEEQAWEVLVGTMAVLEKFSELVTLQQERIQLKDGARARLLLAKAHEKLGNLDRAEEQIRAALKLEPDNFDANLGLAALLMRQKDDRESLDQAGSLLLKTGQMYEKSPSPEHYVSYATLRGFYLALVGRVKEAREQWEEVFRIATDDRDKKQINEALQALAT